MDLRNTVDDNLPLTMEALGYEQSFTLIDIKLALGYLTVAIAGLLFYLDKKFSFKETYYVIAGCVVVYFILSSILYFFTSTPKYKNNKFVGYNESKQKIEVFTWTSKYDPIYNVKIVIDDNDASATVTEFPFMKMFDAFGYYNQDAAVALFKQVLQKKNE